MTEVIESMFGEIEGWKIKTYRSPVADDFKRKASVVEFEGMVTMTVDEVLLRKADRGCNLCNFILAHEIGHLILNHHAKNAVTKNFQLFAGSNGMSNTPPTLEEFEANMAAVFFQCGPALKDARWPAKDLARRAYSDFHNVEKAQRFLTLDTFQQELQRQENRFERVVL